MADVVLICSKCGARLTAPGELIGQRYRCPVCGEIVSMIPTASGSTTMWGGRGFRLITVAAVSLATGLLLDWVVFSMPQKVDNTNAIRATERDVDEHSAANWVPSGQKIDEFSDEMVPLEHAVQKSRTIIAREVNANTQVLVHGRLAWEVGPGMWVTIMGVDYLLDTEQMESTCYVEIIREGNEWRVPRCDALKVVTK